jgi:hypothetical protein
MIRLTSFSHHTILVVSHRRLKDKAAAFRMESIMANDAVANSQASTNPTVSLFQRAHAKMVTLQRVDEQLVGLLEQRRKLQDELRGVQALINDEFERIMTDANEGTAKVLAEFNAPPRPRRSKPPVPSNGNGDAIRLEVAEAV